MINSVIQGDCLEVMKALPDKSVDMILCDLPYGTTACKWDTIIPFEPLWEQYKRIIKDNGAIVLTASQPFTSALVMSNPDMFKYEWIWDKKTSTGGALAKKRPMKAHENILVFNCKFYNPQMGKWDENVIKRMSKKRYEAIPRSEMMHGQHIVCNKEDKLFRGKYPQSVLRINGLARPSRESGLHPTQKPVALFEYLIKTYTNEGDLVLDNCAGSGTTGVACKNLNRNFILIEKEQEYIDIINKRLA